MLDAVADAIIVAEPELSEADRRLGDGDHGLGMKRGMEAVYQLEESELMAEPLPKADLRRSILFYESAEGGAGVLRQLVDDPTTLAQIAREALRICHFDPDTGEDLHHAPRARDCP